MNKGLIDFTETYKSPQAEVLEVKVQSLLCQSNGNTEKFDMSGFNYGDDDWE